MFVNPHKLVYSILDDATYVNAVIATESGHVWKL